MNGYFSTNRGRTVMDVLVNGATVIQGRVASDVSGQGMKTKTGRPDRDGGKARRGSRLIRGSDEKGDRTGRFLPFDAHTFPSSRQDSFETGEQDHPVMYIPVAVYEMAAIGVAAVNATNHTITSSGLTGLWHMILAMQDAVTVSDVESRFLASISAVVGANSYGFSRFDVTDFRLQPLSVRTKGAPEGLVPAYNAIGTDRDPLLAAAISLGSPTYNSGLMSEGDWRSEPMYEVLDGHGLHHSLVVPLFDKARPSGALYLARSSERPFSADEVAILTILQPHVASSLRRAERFAGLQRSVEMLRAAIDQIDSATVITTRDGVEIHSNKAYDRIAGADRRIRSTVASLIGVNASRLAEGTERVVIGTEALSGPTHEDGTDAHPILRIVVRSSVLRTDVETLVSSIYLQRHDTGTPVQSAPLSIREREITAWVAQGLTNRQIAALAFVSENTVRQHLKRIFVKLEVHNRAQLIQAIWQSASP